MGDWGKVLGGLGGGILGNYLGGYFPALGSALSTGLGAAGGSYLGAKYGDRSDSDAALRSALMAGMGGYFTAPAVDSLLDKAANPFSNANSFFNPDMTLDTLGKGAPGAVSGATSSTGSTGGLFSGGLGGNAGLLGLTALGALSSMEEQKDKNKQQERYNQYIQQNLGNVANEGKYLPAMQNAVNATVGNYSDAARRKAAASAADRGGAGYARSLNSIQRQANETQAKTMYPFLEQIYGPQDTSVVQALAQAQAGVPSTKATTLGGIGGTIGTILPYLYLSQLRRG
ncbi:MAG: hypothetical protein PHV00_12215 [Syntrophales bacterium]|nr:hypothetical protein [Syntrophales bacterium]